MRAHCGLRSRRREQAKAAPTAWAALAAALAAAVLAALAGAGCGRDQGRGGQAAPAPGDRTAPSAQETSPAGGPASGGLESAGENQLAPAAGEIQVRSREGGFSAKFPDGCARVRTRAAPAGAAPGEHETVSVWSDRFDRRGEGVMVTTFYKLRGENGGPPNPRTVVGKIEELLQRHNLELVEQRAFNRDGLEGVRAFCRERGGDDVMWIEGLLFADRVYILSGWRSAGGTLSDGQIARFFLSFRPESAS